MVNTKLKQKILRIVEDLKDINPCRCKHFSFICKRNRIISMGMNSQKTTHTLLKRYNYYMEGIHSELDCYIKIRWMDINYSKCVLINVRINRFGQIKMSKPCSCCLSLIKEIGINTVYYTTNEGDFYKLKLSKV